MSILKVARMGHPILREKTRELTAAEIRSSDIQRLIDDMVDTMHEYSGIGLAAPQIHQPIRLAVIELEADNDRYPDLAETDSGLQIIINPKVTVLDRKEQAYWEGCLSVPELRGLVHRPRRIRVDSLGRDGQPQSIEAEGFLATVYQHELDHLEGALFVDRMKDLQKLAFLAEYQRYWAPDEDSDEGDLGE
jgi:peptide deformylase